MKTCIATVTSLNIAIKAQRALGREGIFSRVVRVDPRSTKRGCSNGIEFSLSEMAEAKRVLRMIGVTNPQFIESEGEL